MKKQLSVKYDDYFLDVYRQLAKEFDMDEEQIRAICRSEFRYTSEIMKSNNTKNILFNNLFKFKLKPKYETNKTTCSGDTGESWNRWNV